MLGYNFQPRQDDELRRKLNQNNGGDGQTSPTTAQALKVLSLRLPSVLGGRPIAPDDLLRPSVGGAGGGQSDVVSSVLRSGGATGGAPVPPAQGPSYTNLASPASSPFSSVEPSAGAGESSLLATLLTSAGGGQSGVSSSIPKTSFHFQDDLNMPGPKNPNGTFPGPNPDLDEFMRRIGSALSEDTRRR